jgi:hypothetical protein
MKISLFILPGKKEAFLEGSSFRATFSLEALAAASAAFWSQQTGTCSIAAHRVFDCFGVGVSCLHGSHVEPPLKPPTNMKMDMFEFVQESYL